MVSFVISWQVESGTNSEIYGRKFSADGAPLGDEFNINTHTHIGSIHPRNDVVSFPNGKFVIAWGYWPEGTGSHRIYFQRYDADTTLIGSEVYVYNSNTSELALAAHPNGNFVITYANWIGEAPENQYDIYAKVYNMTDEYPDGLLVPEFEVSEYNTNNKVQPEIAMVPSGNFVITWRSLNHEGDEGYGVYARKLSLTRSGE